jgi:hypothetical protein
MAGESARESARRQQEKAERLQRSAELYARGAAGEEATAAALAALPAESWTVFHDLRWPGRRFANVDHIVVGPPGVFVVDSKNWSGTISVRENVLRQNGRSRQETVAGAADSALAVAQLVPLLRPDVVRPVLCFVREEQMTGWARDVRVCSTPNLVEMLLSRPGVLTPDEVRDVSLELDVDLRPALTSVEGSGSRKPTSRPQRSTAPRPATARSSKGKPKPSWRGLVPAVLGLALAFVLVTKPEFVTGVADRVADVIVGQTSSDDEQPPPERPKRKEESRRK